jgi:hypothetical protein
MSGIDLPGFDIPDITAIGAGCNPLCILDVVEHKGDTQVLKVIVIKKDSLFPWLPRLLARSCGTSW